MVRQQCPPSLRKYGFCGTLTMIYAALLPITSSQDKLKAFLQQIKGILEMGKRKWGRSAPKDTRGISLLDTLQLLQHYNTCDFEVTKYSRCAGEQTMKKWLKTAGAKSSYIVHTTTHAVFIEIGAVKSKWRIYNQGGVYTKTSGMFLKKKGTYTRTGSPAAASACGPRTQCPTCSRATSYSTSRWSSLTTT